MGLREYLRRKEWSMGNGQCPECHGVPQNWHGHPLHLTGGTIGHKKECSLAAALSETGESPLMIGDFKSDIEYEPYITDGGFYSTRPKTKDGCPKIKAINKAINDEFNKKLIETLAGKLSC